MKRLSLLTVILMAGIAVQAAPVPTEKTLEQFVAAQKAAAEKKGAAFDEAAAKKGFEKKDVNKDGKLSVEEQAPAPKKVQ